MTHLEFESHHQIYCKIAQSGCRANTHDIRDLQFYSSHFPSRNLRPYWAIYCTFGNLSKPVAATIIVPKSPKFFGNFCKVFEIFHFAIEIILG